MSDTVSQDTTQGKTNHHLIAGGVSLAGLVTLTAFTSFISCDTSRNLNFYAPLLLALGAAYQAGFDNASKAVSNKATSLYATGKGYANSFGLFNSKASDTAAATNETQADAEVQAEETRRYTRRH